LGLGGDWLGVSTDIGIDPKRWVKSKPLPPLLSARQAADDLIGEAVGVGVYTTTTREIGQGAELAINGGIKTPDNQIIGVIGGDARETLHGGL
jgi:hypothetical protein